MGRYGNDSARWTTHACSRETCGRHVKRTKSDGLSSIDVLITWRDRERLNRRRSIVLSSSVNIMVSLAYRTRILVLGRNYGDDVRRTGTRRIPRKRAYTFGSNVLRKSRASGNSIQSQSIRD
ncbi:unnamed protein product [Lasius platythorax]|uniref:Uncharacterized protein n=1 Tax=Lasius platythorax TaxID=488582 RepID=A0AAV2NSR4_9HYME